MVDNIPLKHRNCSNGNIGSGFKAHNNLAELNHHLNVSGLNGFNHRLNGSDTTIITPILIFSSFKTDNFIVSANNVNKHLQRLTSSQKTTFTKNGSIIVDSTIMYMHIAGSMINHNNSCRTVAWIL